MSTSTKGSRLYGFEDYKVVHFSEELLFASWSGYIPWRIESLPVTYLTVDDSLPVEVEEHYYSNYDFGVRFKPSLCENHPELLETAKKVYVHQSCKLSRSMMAEKYGKCLNPFLADVVVVPEPIDRRCSLMDVTLFANDAAKLIVLVDVIDSDSIAKAQSFETGKTFRELCVSQPLERSTTDYKIEDCLNAGFFSACQCISIPNNQSFILDILTRQLPVGRTVFEQTVQESLSTEDNRVTLDILTNIHDMLNSSDSNTVGAGLKALSMMDYMHYPNSIRYIIKRLNRNDYRYNKASNSTSVRFMFKQLCPNNPKRNQWPGNYDSQIYEQDFELLKQLIKHYEPGYRDKVYDRLVYMAFITTDSNNMVIPRFKQ